MKRTDGPVAPEFSCGLLADGMKFRNINRAPLILVFGVCFSLSSCKGSETIWASEARSPDGKLIATANAFEQSGFGTGWAGTNVYLNWSTGSQPPMLIFAVADASKAPDLEMKWLTSSRLELIYKGRAPINFQAIKCDGADISLRDLSSEKSDSSR